MRALVAIAIALVVAQHRTPDAPYVPSPDETVGEILRLANVTKDDVVYDLGSGDGRIVIEAARRFGARGVGVEIDPKLVAEARANAERAGVGDRVRFVEGDLFETDFGEATVLTLYLGREVNMKLRPRILRDLKPGSRVVSHNFDMGDWAPQKTVDFSEDSTLYLWIISATDKHR